MQRELSLTYTCTNIKISLCLVIVSCCLLKVSSCMMTVHQLIYRIKTIFLNFECNFIEHQTLHTFEENPFLYSKDFKYIVFKMAPYLLHSTNAKSPLFIIVHCVSGNQLTDTCFIPPQRGGVWRFGGRAVLDNKGCVTESMVTADRI